MKWKIEIEPGDVDRDYVQSVVDELMAGGDLQEWLDVCDGEMPSNLHNTAANAATVLYAYQVYLIQVAREWGEIGPESEGAK